MAAGSKKPKSVPGDGNENEAADGVSSWWLEGHKRE